MTRFVVTFCVDIQDVSTIPFKYIFYIFHSSTGKLIVVCGREEINKVYGKESLESFFFNLESTFDLVHAGTMRFAISDFFWVLFIIKLLGNCEYHSIIGKTAMLQKWLGFHLEGISRMKNFSRMNFISFDSKLKTILVSYLFRLVGPRDLLLNFNF